MSMEHRFSSIQNAKALRHVSSWRAITGKFARYGTGWVYPGICIPRQEQKIIIALRRISFSRSVIRGISSKIRWNLPIAQLIAASGPTATWREHARTAAIHQRAATSAIIADARSILLN